ncbi:tRNA wybutosine-synthesizing protein 3 homolog [Liolophura sinensis]|uniref:tRNA wybutosine-synthesizing protein 3 homolog n=1 Tax=Liolophura sinensis TaxID=3198878 RepID=UPI003158B86F
MAARRSYLGGRNGRQIRQKQGRQIVSGRRKGSIDSSIVPVVEYINESCNYFTTSSCSGRIIILEQSTSSKAPTKRGCKWHYTSHNKSSAKDVMDSLQCCEEDLVFKFEPFIMHIQCRSLPDAQAMHSAAVASGFRNSGITISSKGKTMMALRSSHGLEVPLSHNGQLLVSEQYITFLVDIANQKMEENLIRVERFFEAIQKIQCKEEKLPKTNKSKRKGKESEVKDFTGHVDSQKTESQMHLSHRITSEDTFNSCLGLFQTD